MDLSFLWELVHSALNWFLSIFTACFGALWNMVTDLFVWIFKAALDLAISAISALDISGLPSLSSYIGSLPAETLNVLGLCHVGTALGIVVSAIVIRFLLQLIPFVRLGS